MRRASTLTLVLIVMTLGITATAAATQDRVRIALLTPTVSPGGILTLRATNAQHTSNCVASLHGPSATVLRLSTHRSTTGKFEWQYRMPTGVPVGKWSAVVSCGSSGHASKDFSLMSPTPAAQVVVATNGFTQSNFTSGSETAISYGVVLQNKSGNVDALGISVTVSFVDTLGRSVTSNETTVTGIPADGNFYLGGLAASNVSLTVAGMNVTVSVASSQAHRLVLPSVSGMSLQSDGFGDESVSGTFTNPYQAPIPSDANIYVVYIGPQGNVVGGASETAGAAVEPGHSVAFGFSDLSSWISTFFVQSSSVSSVQSSVDPCVSFSSCPAQVPASG